MWHRDFFDADIVACPDDSVIGKSFGQVGVERGGQHPVDAFLDLVLEHGTELRWRTTISNHRPEVLAKIAREPGVQIGFSDAGAHLRNMAFYNFGLRLLKHVRDAETAGQAVHDGRARRAPAHRRARPTGTASTPATSASATAPTCVVLDPDRLDDSLEEYAEAPVEQYGGLSRMVNRNDATVSLVLVGGRAVWRDGAPIEPAGQRADRSVPARRRARARALRPHPGRVTPTDEAVRGLWRTLSDRDYDGIADWVTDDCIYLDMPLGPALRRPRARRHREAAPGRLGRPRGVREPRRAARRRRRRT